MQPVDSQSEDGRTLARNVPVNSRSMALTKGLRGCKRRGCSEKVKKPTAKYCSVSCCSIDPERRERLRRRPGHQSGDALVPLAHQLSLRLVAGNGDEAQLALLGEGREDIPGGLSRWAG